MAPDKENQNYFDNNVLPVRDLEVDLEVEIVCATSSLSFYSLTFFSHTPLILDSRTHDITDVTHDHC